MASVEGVVYNLGNHGDNTWMLDLIRAVGNKSMAQVEDFIFYMILS